VLPLILSEMAGDKPGGTQIVERYAEILLIQTLRLHYARSPAKAGFFAGLENPRLARAVSRIHREFSTPLSLADLAETAAMSRSSFAHHFKQVTNISPIEYLARWRMIKAGEVLRGSDDPVAVVAEHVGYDSDISFSRAFKREYGITPARFRRSGQDARPQPGWPARGFIKTVEISENSWHYRASRVCR
jgi:transcriptional regulator GlxA family with amidase domain